MVIGVNIIIAFALDIYGAVERLDRDYEANTRLLVKKSLEKRNSYLKTNTELNEDSRGSEVLRLK